LDFVLELRSAFRRYGGQLLDGVQSDAEELATLSGPLALLLLYHVEAEVLVKS